MSMGATRWQKYFSTSTSATNLHMHYVDDHALYALQSQSDTPVLRKFDLAFDSTTNLVSHLDLSVSQSYGKIDSGYVSVYKVDES